MQTVFISKLENFYSRPCGRGDPASGTISVHVPLFLLTPLREGRPAHLRPAVWAVIYFYSRPCGRGDNDHFESHRWGSISTHAPAGGATGRWQHEKSRRNISTHAPAGGATLGMEEIPCVVTISTHAPAGGATAARRYHLRRKENFYSRPCGRGDGLAGLRCTSWPISTHAPAGGATRCRLLYRA